MTHAGTSNQLLLSVAILVRDEANVIADTIENVAPIADEIVVIDTGSTDRTVAIARRTGARVVEIPWTDDFSAARNAAWQHLAGEWVLWIDADERLTAGSLDQIRPFLQRQPAGVAAHVVMVAVPPAAPGNIGEEAGRIRLVRRSANVQFEGRVVESLKPALNRADLGIMLSDIRLTRSIREHDAELKARRAQRNQRLIDLETAERGVSPRLLQAAGEIQATCGRRQAAIELFRQAIDMAEAGSTEMLEAYYGLLTSLGEQSDDHDRLLAVGLEALEVFPLDSHLLCLMGSHLETQDRHETAEQSFRVAHQFGQIDPFTWHVREIGEIVAVCLATSIESKGEIDEAITVLNEAAKRFGDSQRIWRRLLELQIKIANHEEALAVVDRMRLTPSEQGALRSAVRGSCLAVRENWIPARAIARRTRGGLPRRNLPAMVFGRAAGQRPGGGRRAGVGRMATDRARKRGDRHVPDVASQRDQDRPRRPQRAQCSCDGDGPHAGPAGRRPSHGAPNAGANDWHNARGRLVENEPPGLGAVQASGRPG
jgi:predicted negative regulator of RcsB-dependent stress response